MKEWIQSFITEGMSKEQVRGFTRGTYRLAIAAGLAGAYGVLSFLGFDGFAFASDVERKISEKQTVIVADLQTMKASAAQTTHLLNRQLAAGIASQIRAQATKRCPPAKEKDREAANREIDKLQEEYREFMSERYSIPECGVL